MVDANIRLRFEDVHLASAPGYAGAIAGLSFALRAGELAVVQTTRHRRLPPIADLAQGLLAPTSGLVGFEGEDWNAMGADRTNACRGAIGRVFAGPAWISNLDVDENVTLRERYHSGRLAGDVRAAATELAQGFGLERLPSTRPAWTPPQDLIRAQWVRALLGKPRLLLLEDAEHDAPESSVEAWRAAVAGTLRGGAAVLWIGSDIPAAPGGVAPRYRFEVRGTDLALVEERKS